MKRFTISAAVTTAPKKITVIIDAPGIEPGGLRREFSSRAEANVFVDAMNLGFDEGFKRGSKAQRTMTAGAGDGWLSA